MAHLPPVAEQVRRSRPVMWLRQPGRLTQACFVLTLLAFAVGLIGLRVAQVSGTTAAHVSARQAAAADRNATDAKRIAADTASTAATRAIQAAVSAVKTPVCEFIRTTFIDLQNAPTTARGEEQRASALRFAGQLGCPGIPPVTTPEENRMTTPAPTDEATQAGEDPALAGPELQQGVRHADVDGVLLNDEPEQ